MVNFKHARSLDTGDRMRRSLCLMSAPIGALLMSGEAALADGRFELRSANMIAHADPFAPDDAFEAGAPAQFDLETAFDSNTWVRRVQPLSGRQVLRIEGQVRARAYTDRDELNSLLLTPRLQYWNTTQDNVFQVRLSAGWSHMSRDGEERWTRPEAEAQLRYRHEGERRFETVFRLRANAYDFKPANLQGLDSDRVRVGVEQFFRPEDTSLQVRVSAFFEQADADDAAFSFDETRLRGELSWSLDEKTRAAVLADFRDRDYDGAFPGASFSRADERWEVEARVERTVTERVQGFVAVGYLDNGSNIEPRDYGGVTFRAGFRLAL